MCVCNEEQSGSDEENGKEIDWLQYGAWIVNIIQAKATFFKELKLTIETLLVKNLW